MNKTCSKCKETKDVNAFRKDASTTDGLARRCRRCASDVQRSGYTERYGDASRERIKARRQHNVQVVQEMKSTLGCHFCDEKEPVCLEFHHIDPKEKDFNLAQNMGMSLDRLHQEIAKCVCVCSNCHRKIHAGILKLSIPVD